MGETEANTTGDRSRYLRWAFFGLPLFLLALNSADTLMLIGEKGGQARHYFLWIDQWTINSMIALMAFMCVRRHYSLIALPFVLFCGQAIYDRMLLTETLHEVLNKFEWYHAAFGRHATNVVNQQYGMLITYCLFLTVIVALTIFKKTRTFDRLIATVTATSILATFALFHTFLIMNINQSIDVEKRTLSSVFVGDPTAIQSRCSAVGAMCHSISRTTPDRDSVTGAPIDQVIANTLSDVANHNIRLSSPYAWSETSQIGNVTEFWVASIITEGDTIHLATSGAGFKASTDLYELQFEVQSTAAHVTWLLIFIALASIHRKRARGKIRQMLPSKAFA